MTWLLVASLYIGYSPSEIQTKRFETEAECIQHGNRLLMQDARYKYFCTNIERK